MTHPGPGRTQADEAEQPEEPMVATPQRGSGWSSTIWRRPGVAIGIVVAVVVLVAGGIGTWVAVSRAGETGSSSPQQAATNLLADVGNDDLLGVLSDLPPNEAALLGRTVEDAANQLQHVQVVKPDVDSAAQAGLSIRTSGIRFDSAAVGQVNGHIAITELVAGRITIGARLSTNGYTESFLHAAFPNGTPAGMSTTVDIAQVARQLGHPVRIATVKVGDRWYPSLFYSIADSVLQADHLRWPTRSVPAAGSDVPDEAAEDFLQAVLNSDTQTAIAHTAPDEMAALHDMGQALPNVVHNSAASQVTIAGITFDDRRVQGGVEAVLRNMTLTAHGQKIVVARTIGCYTVVTGSTRDRLCGAGIADQLRNITATKSLPPAVTKLLVDMSTGLANDGVGIVTTENRELWYVNPGLSIVQLAQGLDASATEQDLAAVLAPTRSH